MTPAAPAVLAITSTREESGSGRKAWQYSIAAENAQETRVAVMLAVLKERVWRAGRRLASYARRSRQPPFCPLERFVQEPPRPKVGKHLQAHEWRGPEVRIAEVD